MWYQTSNKSELGDNDGTENNNLDVHLRIYLLLHVGNLDLQPFIKPLHVRHFEMKGMKQACSKRVFPLCLCQLPQQALVCIFGLCCLQTQIKLVSILHNTSMVLLCL